jgi:hypothetical protein
LSALAQNCDDGDTRRDLLAIAEFLEYLLEN